MSSGAEPSSSTGGCCLLRAANLGIPPYKTFITSSAAKAPAQQARGSGDGVPHILSSPSARPARICGGMSAKPAKVQQAQRFAAVPELVSSPAFGGATP